MNQSEKKILQEIGPKLFNSFEPLDILPHLIVHEMISTEDVASLRSEIDRRFRVANLLAMLQRTSASLASFACILNETGYNEFGNQILHSLNCVPPVVPMATSSPPRSLWTPTSYKSTPTPPPYVEQKAKHTGLQAAQPMLQTVQFRQSAQSSRGNSLPNSPRSSTSSSIQKAGQDLLKPTFADPKTNRATSRPTMSGNVKRLKQFFEATLNGVPHKDDLDFLLQKTKFNKQQIIDWFREFAKACPDGRLTKPLFVKFYRRLDPNEPYTNQFCEHVFRCFDMDKSGHIDFKEFLMALNIKFSGTPEQKLEWTFRMYDIDDNGWIELQEMVLITDVLFEMLGNDEDFRGKDRYSSAVECAEAVFKTMDKNRDGKITRQEFIQGCLADANLYSILTSASTSN